MDIEGFMLNTPGGDLLNKESIRVSLQKEAELEGTYQASVCGSLANLWATNF